MEIDVKKSIGTAIISSLRRFMSIVFDCPIIY